MRYSLFSLAGIVVLVLLYSIIHLSFLRVDHVTFSGVETLDPVELEGVAKSVLTGSTLGIFPRDSIFFVSSSHVEKILFEKFPKLETIHASRDGLSGVEVEVTERKPAVLVCSGFHEVGVEETESADETCFFADEKGYVFAPAPEFSGGVYLRYYLSADEGVDPLGKTFVELERFQKLQAFASSLTARGIKVRGMLLAPDGMYEAYVKNTDQSEAIVYFDDKSPFEKTASNLTAFWDNAHATKTAKKNATSTSAIFEYINLRFGNNIFYVLK